MVAAAALEEVEVGVEEVLATVAPLAPDEVGVEAAELLDTTATKLLGSL